LEGFKRLYYSLKGFYNFSGAPKGGECNGNKKGSGQESGSKVSCKDICQEDRKEEIKRFSVRSADFGEYPNVTKKIKLLRWV